jgi:hypothetical protein
MPRDWCIKATITMPKFTRMEAGGGFPKQFNQHNVFPVQLLLDRNGLKIWMKCKEVVTQIKPGENFTIWHFGEEKASSYREPTKCPYYLEAKVSADNGSEAVSKVIGEMGGLADLLTFRLQYSVQIVHVEAYSPSKSAGIFDVVTYAQTPDYRIPKDAVAVFADKISYSSFEPSWTQLKPEEAVGAALRWYAKGLGEETLIDKFTFYWIAFETLATHWPGIDAKHCMECPRCRNEIPKCPICGQSTESSPRIAERARRVGTLLGRTREEIEALYSARHLVHGTIQLKSEKEIEDLPPLTQKLRGLVVDAIKTRLGVAKAAPPLVEPNVSIMWSTLAVTATAENLPWPCPK